MTRKSVKIKLNDGKNYVFAERNIEDIDNSHLQEALRDSVFDRIIKYQNEKRITDAMADDLRYVNFQKIYLPAELNEFVNVTPEEIYRLTYASFKIENSMPFDEYEKLLTVGKAKTILNDINEIEKGEPLLDKECAAEIGMNFIKFKDLKKTQPDIYWYLKYNVKKKAGKG